MGNIATKDFQYVFATSLVSEINQNHGWAFHRRRDWLRRHLSRVGIICQANLSFIEGVTNIDRAKMGKIIASVIDKMKIFYPNISFIAEYLSVFPGDCLVSVFHDSHEHDWNDGFYELFDKLLGESGVDCGDVGLSYGWSFHPKNRIYDDSVSRGWALEMMGETE
jgi:hypothetical protein